MVLYWAAVIGLWNVAPHLAEQGRLAVEGLAALAAGGWCGVNFWRCRHAHCLVSGTGWLALGVVALVGAGLGHSLMGGDEQPVCLGVLVAAVAFEGAWSLVRGGNAIPPRTRSARAGGEGPEQGAGPRVRRPDTGLWSRRRRARARRGPLTR